MAGDIDEESQLTHLEANEKNGDGHSEFEFQDKKDVTVSDEVD